MNDRDQLKEMLDGACNKLNVIKDMVEGYESKSYLDEFLVPADFIIAINEFVICWIKFEEQAVEQFLKISLKIQEMVEKVLDSKKMPSKELTEVHERIKKVQLAMNEIYYHFENKDRRKTVVIYGNTNYMYLFMKMRIPFMVHVQYAVLTQQNEFNEEYFEQQHIQVVNKSELKNLQCDFLVLCDQMPWEDLQRCKGISIDFSGFINIYLKPSTDFLSNWQEGFEMLQGNYQGIVTGISYMMCGILKKDLAVPMALVASSSQDLYYDYKLFQYVYQKAVKPEQVKYAVVGLALYSFEYDLSKSPAVANKAACYYPILGTMHHYIEQDILIPNYHRILNVLDELLMGSYHENLWSIVGEGLLTTYDKRDRIEFDSKALTPDQRTAIIEEGRHVFSKDNPETSKENKQIFKEYISYLKSHEIKTLVVIPPYTSIYQGCIDKDMEQRTLEVVEECRRKYDFTFWNLARSNDFEDQEFSDSSHLNYRGAKKLTGWINQWMKDVGEAEVEIIK